MKIKEFLEKYGEVEISEDKEKKLKELLNTVELKESEKWKPERGHNYYCITGCGYVNKVMNVNDSSDDGYISLSNCFKTREEAEFRLEQIKVYNELKNFADENNDEIDWNNGSQPKFYIYYDSEDKKVSINSNYYWKSLSQIYFSNTKSVDQAIKVVGEDRIKKYLFGAED